MKILFWMKMEPIFRYLFKYVELPVQMRIGYRYDEQERIKLFNEDYKFPQRCEYRPKSGTWIQRWETIKWRVGEFPLITDRKFHYQVHDYWDGKGIDFPEDSNCLNCFWKQPEQLHRNFTTDNAIMQWAKIQEDLQGNTFKEKLNFHQVERLPPQLAFSYGTGSGCQAGFCTD